MRQIVLGLLPASLLLVPALASADPARLNNPAPPPVAPTPVAPPPTYDAPPAVQPGYNAPPPVTGYNAPPPVARTQPVMMTQPQPYGRQPVPVVQPPPPARQGLFVGLLGGAAIPVVGEYGEFLSTGFMGYAHIGWATGSGISVRAELGARSNGFTDLPGTSYTTVFYGAAFRWTAPRGVFRPYLEGIVDAFSVLAESDSSGPVTTTSSSGTGVSVGAAAGAEIELSNSFALELVVRYDHVVLSPNTDDGTGGLIGILGGGTYYF